MECLPFMVENRSGFDDFRWMAGMGVKVIGRSYRAFEGALAYSLMQV
jgi:hypothetical protein